MTGERAKKVWDEVAAFQRSDDSENSILMGPHTAFQYRTDPKHLCFVLSRYKFCSKMLAGKGDVLEVGCGDAFGTPLVAQTVKSVVGIDWDATLVASTERRLAFLKNCVFRHADITAQPIGALFDGIYSIDVLEHIDPEMEDQFMRHCCMSLRDSGLFIVGTPNEKASLYASPSSKAGHINLKDSTSLMALLEKYFETTLMFGMNDEVLHTGFLNMAHYLFAVSTGVKKR